MRDLEHGVRRGDCLDPVVGLASLPDRCVAHVITDPPYSEDVHRPGALPRGKVLDFGQLEPEQMRELAGHFARVARRWVIVFCAAEMAGPWKAALEAAGLDFVRTGAWMKTDAAPQLSGDRPSAGFEALAIAHRPGRKRWHGGGRPAVWTGPSREQGILRQHPTQKPLALMEALIRDFTDPGETILDPFAGSGTTGVACKRLGRAFIGWERDPKYHAIAERRIRDAREQLEIEMAIKAKQEALL